MNWTKNIWSFVSVAVLMVISFLAGAKMEQDTHVQEVNENWNDIETLQAQVDQDTWTRDYNALMNTDFADAVERLGGRKLKAEFKNIQAEYDSIKLNDGKLVVPDPIPELE